MGIASARLPSVSVGAELVRSCRWKGVWSSLDVLWVVIATHLRDYPPCVCGGGQVVNHHTVARVACQCTTEDRG